MYVVTEPGVLSHERVLQKHEVQSCVLGMLVLTVDLLVPNIVADK